jgi:DNA-3-methyladenine glycosylase
MNGKPADRKSGLWIESRNGSKPKRIKALPRVGVDYAGPLWRNKKLRFLIT